MTYREFKTSVHHAPPGSNWLRYLTSLLVIGGLLVMTGCKTSGKGVSLLDDGAIVLKGKLPKGPVPAYETLMEKYNRRAAAVPQFTSQAQIEIFYHDRNGKRHYEQADSGRVIMLLPDHMAVLVRKFGVGDLFLAGSNAKRYWLFDLTDKDRRVLYEGSKAADQTAAGLQPLPLPVQPRDLPTLMGLEQLPKSKGDVAAVQGGYLVSPQGKDWRVVLDAKTSLPLRVDLLREVTDEAGRTTGRQVYMTALLSMPVALETYGVPNVSWPVMMKRVELRPHDSGDYLVVHLSAMLNEGEVTAEDRAFDFDRLKRTYKPDEVVDLDRPRE